MSEIRKPSTFSVDYVPGLSFFTGGCKFVFHGYDACTDLGAATLADMGAGIAKLTNKKKYVEKFERRAQVLSRRARVKSLKSNRAAISMFPIVGNIKLWRHDKKMRQALPSQNLSAPSNQDERNDAGVTSNSTTTQSSTTNRRSILQDNFPPASSPDENDLNTDSGLNCTQSLGTNVQNTLQDDFPPASSPDENKLKGNPNPTERGRQPDWKDAVPSSTTNRRSILQDNFPPASSPDDNDLNADSGLNCTQSLGTNVQNTLQADFPPASGPGNNNLSGLTQHVHDPKPDSPAPICPPWKRQVRQFIDRLDPIHLSEDALAQAHDLLTGQPIFDSLEKSQDLETDRYRELLNCLVENNLLIRLAKPLSEENQKAVSNDEVAHLQQRLVQAECTSSKFHQDVQNVLAITELMALFKGPRD